MVVVAGSRELTLDELVELARKARLQGKKTRPGVARRPTRPAPTEPVPVFDSSLPVNLTARLGGTAFLHCRVTNLNGKAVSPPSSDNSNQIYLFLYVYDNFSQSIF